MGQQRQNTGRRRWSVYVGRRRSQSQMNGVAADGRQRRVDSHLPSTTVPGQKKMKPNFTWIGSGVWNAWGAWALKPKTFFCNICNRQIPAPIMMTL